MKPHFLVTFLTIAAFLAACTMIPQPLNQVNSPQSGNMLSSLIGAKTQLASVRADEATPQTLTFPDLVPPQAVEQADSLPNTSAGQSQTLDFVTSAPVNGQIKMPDNGSFQLIAVAGPSFQILDNDATDGTAKVQVPGPAFDLYVRPEASSTTQESCASPTPTTSTGTQLLDQIDQTVISKANQLTAAGQSQCVYLPPTNQRQNANCNTTSTGIQCSGPVNKTILPVSCPEIALYGGAMTINNALPSSKLFVAVQNNLTINQSVKGIFSSRGDLNTNLNNSSQLSGVFVGARSNNLNLSGSAKVQGLYTILNQGSLSMNLNPSAIFEGELCTTGTANINRNGVSQLIYNPNQITSWQSDLPFVLGMMCIAGNKPYTQTVAMACPTASPVTQGSVKIEDGLYYIKQTLNSANDGNWSKLPGRPMPIPDDWHSGDQNQYILALTNNGLSKISTRWLNTRQINFPAGIKEMGPTGGSIELPGVGKIEFPPNALTQQQVIVLKQKKQVAEILDKQGFTDKIVRVFDFASAVMEVYPIGQMLNQEATVYLQTNKARLGNNHPGILKWAGSFNGINDWSGLHWKKELMPLSMKYEDWTDDIPATTPYLGIFAKLIMSDIRPDEGVRIWPTSNVGSDSFITQQQNPVPALDFYINYDSGHENEAIDIAGELESAYILYHNLVNVYHGALPEPSQEGSAGKKIPVYLKTNSIIALTTLLSQGLGGFVVPGTDPRGAVHV